MAFLSFPSPTQLRNLSDPASNQDAATKAYVDASLSGGTGTISVGNVSATGNITATGNVTANNANLGNTVGANYFVGNGSYLSNVTGSNISGQVSNSLVSGTVYTNAQPNITSVGTLTDLTVSGNVTAGNIKTDHLLYSNGTAYTIASFTNDSGYITSSSLSGYATQTDVSNAVANLVASAPAALDTLNELANALGNDASYSTTITNILANKLSTTSFNSTANTWISTQTTSNLSEGTNLYYTDTRANSAIDARVTKTFVDNLAVVANIANVAYSIDGANVTGYVANATHANLADSANSVSGSNVTGQVGNALVAGTVYTNAQPNITSVGTLTTLTVNGAINLGAIGNLKITGGNANYILKTDGTGNLAWAAPSASSSGTLTADVDSFTGDGANTSFTLGTAPQGVNYSIVVVQGVVQPKSVYTISGSTLTFSSAPPNTADIEVTTFGGNVSSGNASPSSTSMPWNIASSNATMTINNGYFVDTTASAITMTLPASATIGDMIRINDLAGTFNTHNLTVARNSHKIQGVADDLLVDYAQASATLVYSNSTYGWKILES